MSDGEKPSGPPEKGRGRGKKSARNGSEGATSRDVSTRARAKDKRPGRTEANDAKRRRLKAALIELVATSGLEVNPAAAKIGVHRNTVHEWKRDDPEFAKALQYAYEVDGPQALAEVVRSRAVDGWLEPVFHKGKVCGHVRKFSDTLLAMAMRKRDPAYKDPKYIVQPEAPRLPGDVLINLDSMTPAEREVLRKVAERQAKAKGVAR